MEDADGAEHGVLAGAAGERGEAGQVEEDDRHDVTRDGRERRGERAAALPAEAKARGHIGSAGRAALRQLNGACFCHAQHALLLCLCGHGCSKVKNPPAGGGFTAIAGTTVTSRTPRDAHPALVRRARIALREPETRVRHQALVRLAHAFVSVKPLVSRQWETADIESLIK